MHTHFTIWLAVVVALAPCFCCCTVAAEEHRVAASAGDGTARCEVPSDSGAEPCCCCSASDEEAGEKTEGDGFRTSSKASSCACHKHRPAAAEISPNKASSSNDAGSLALAIESLYLPQASIADVDVRPFADTSLFSVHWDGKAILRALQVLRC